MALTEELQKLRDLGFDIIDLEGLEPILSVPKQSSITLHLDTYTELSLIRGLVRDERHKIIQSMCELLPKKERNLENFQKVEQMILKSSNPLTDEGRCNSILKKIEKIEEDLSSVLMAKH